MKPKSKSIFLKLAKLKPKLKFQSVTIPDNNKPRHPGVSMDHAVKRPVEEKPGYKNKTKEKDNSPL